MGTSENGTGQRGSYLEAGGYFLFVLEFYHFGGILLYLHKKGVISPVTLVIFPLLEGESDSQGSNQTSLIEKNKALRESLRSSLTSSLPPFPIYPKVHFILPSKNILNPSMSLYIY